MRIRLINIILLMLVITVNSCIEEYWPDVSKYENLMVVDGIIHNQQGPYTINISISASIDRPKYIPYPECEVIISDDRGNSETLVEYQTGTYETAYDGIRGIPGRKYKITINTPEGKTYESDYQLLKNPVGIDSVYGVVEQHLTEDPYEDGLGVQFYLDTDKAPSDSAFFLWRTTETYIYESDFTIDYLYMGYFKRFHDPDTLLTCWKTEKINEIYTYNTLSLTEPRITNYPLHFVSNGSKRLTIRYSLLVQQFTIDYTSQGYWNKLEEQSSDQGSLYSKQPYQIRGNLRNINDEDEPVMGYFTVAGLTEKRIFLNRPFHTFDYGVCFPDTDPRGFYYTYWRWWPVYAYLTDDGLYAHAPKSCFDCTLHGGTLTMPWFWTK